MAIASAFTPVPEAVARLPSRCRSQNTPSAREGEAGLTGEARMLEGGSHRKCIIPAARPWCTGDSRSAGFRPCRCRRAPALRQERTTRGSGALGEGPRLMGSSIERPRRNRLRRRGGAKEALNDRSSGSMARDRALFRRSGEGFDPWRRVDAALTIETGSFQRYDVSSFTCRPEAARAPDGAGRPFPGRRSAASALRCRSKKLPSRIFWWTLEPSRKLRGTVDD
jgi:hypothetical protein